MNKPFSPILRAGNLIRLLGWLTMAFSIIIASAVVLIFVAQGTPLESYFLPIFGVAICASLAMLTIGTGVKENRKWAKVLGAIVAVLAMVNIPLGTVIGAFTLVNLAKGWSDGA